MITIITDEINPLSQDDYDSIINSLELQQTSCSVCNHHGCLIRYGTYSRTIKNREFSFRLSIQRVRCTACGTTHALLLSMMVPYSQIPLKKQVEIINASETDGKINAIPDDTVDENNIASVIRSFRKHWKERLRFAGIRILAIPNLIFLCFAHFGQQFMQIKNTPNNLFLRPT